MTELKSLEMNIYIYIYKDMFFFTLKQKINGIS